MGRTCTSPVSSLYQYSKSSRRLCKGKRCAKSSRLDFKVEKPVPRKHEGKRGLWKARPLDFIQGWTRGKSLGVERREDWRATENWNIPRLTGWRKAKGKAKGEASFYIGSERGKARERFCGIKSELSAPVSTQLKLSSATKRNERLPLSGPPILRKI